MPILIHGDAAFTGQGIVAEVFNLQSLPGYETGGTIHLIANNQIGFTTDPDDARSTRYASDLAKGFDVPIVHVNADDVDACIAAVHLAVDFRRAFGRDALIDLIGYRRFGHNEQDEPAYTQPDMVERIKNHPTVRELFANKLVNQGVIDGRSCARDGRRGDAAPARGSPCRARYDRRRTPRGRKMSGSNTFDGTVLPAGRSRAAVAWSEALTAVPEGFALNRKLRNAVRAAQNDHRGERNRRLGNGRSRSPSRRCSRRHADSPYRPRHRTRNVQPSPRTSFTRRPSPGRLQKIRGARLDTRCSISRRNKPPSRFAIARSRNTRAWVSSTGTRRSSPTRSCLWEAQYGDFFNGAEIIVDQFIAAGQAKWGQTSRLTLLLPHGYEGAGPEHSSARLERFLQLVAEGNLRVAEPSVASNYYHLLRMQARSPIAVPLVVMTPKSLLRADIAAGRLDEWRAEPSHRCSTIRESSIASRSSD